MQRNPLKVHTPSSYSNLTTHYSYSPNLLRLTLMTLSFGILPIHTIHGEDQVEQTQMKQTQIEQIHNALQHLSKPETPNTFTQLKHLPPWQQGETSTCWSFATSSFIESELLRLKKPSPRLNVDYPLYYNLQKKARFWIHNQGKSHFSPGDLFTGVFDVIHTQGMVPAEIYGQKRSTSDQLNHHILYRDVKKLITQTKKANKNLNEEQLIKALIPLLDRELGRPPEQFTWQGKSYTPQSFVHQNITLPWKDYHVIMSLKDTAFGQWTTLKVPDNWQQKPIFFNVPLTLFYQAIKQALTRGFTVAIDADITEPSLKLTHRYAFHPTDNQSIKNEQDYRESLFKNGQTTDDHLMHIVGYHSANGHDWFLVKDSLDTSWKTSSNGYVFMHSSYIKFKVLAFLVHRDGVPSLHKLLDAATPAPFLGKP